MLTKEQLEALEQRIYDTAMGGDIRIGFYLLKLFYKDLMHVKPENDNNAIGVIFLPEINNSVADDITVDTDDNEYDEI